mmetsp:Transcript_58251/g.188582  ORF Transcript_58251/g.188582 Transcript_58251/m.188582 type:complete len:232 (+) Transcript_58251:316-1011(+)
MCLIYTHEANHDLAHAAAATWGRRCNGLAIFSDVGGEVGGQEVFRVPEEARGYEGVWRKVWLAWQFAHSVLWFAEWFALSTDDTFWIIENLRLLLRCPRIAALHAERRPIYLGRTMWSEGAQVAFHQGAGYVLNGAAVIELMMCPWHIVVEDTSAEDLQVARCLHARGVPTLDVNDCIVASNLKEQGSMVHDSRSCKTKKDGGAPVKGQQQQQEQQQQQHQQRGRLVAWRW